jgi:acyl-CoA reductase-like NAD-dependent aldehyde dehydrogenase
MERVYVDDAIYDRFVPALVRAVEEMRLGADFDYTADMGSLVGAAQLRRVQQHVGDAVAKGATVLAGGRPRPDLGPHFFEPTLLTDVTDAMEVCATETFGPVATVYRVHSTQEAIDAANATPYGLSANIWTGDRKEGRRVASALRAGSVSVNETYAAFWGSIDGPMGGMGDSGLGRRHGREGMVKYTDPQTVAVQRWRGFAVPRGVSQRRFADSMTFGVRLLDRLGRP